MLPHAISTQPIDACIAVSTPSKPPVPALRAKKSAQAARELIECCKHDANTHLRATRVLVSSAWLPPNFRDQLQTPTNDSRHCDGGGGGGGAPGCGGGALGGGMPGGAPGMPCGAPGGGGMRGGMPCMPCMPGGGMPGMPSDIPGGIPGRYNAATRRGEQTEIGKAGPDGSGAKSGSGGAHAHPAWPHRCTTWGASALY